MQSTLAALSRFCPCIATSGMIRCRAYRSISEGVNATDDTRSPSRSGMIMDACDHKRVTIVKVHRGLYPILNAIEVPNDQTDRLELGP